MTFPDRVGTVWPRVRPHLELALVPALTSLLAIENIRRVTQSDGFTIGATFRFPAPIIDLWTFVNVPAPQAGGLFVSPLVAFFPVLLVVEGLIAAGYLGSVEATLRSGTYDFVDSVRRYGVRIVIYTVLWNGVVFLLGLLAVANPVFILVGIVLFLWLSYRLYATPYLIVTRDLSLGAALERSWGWGREGGEYFRFGVGYLLTVAAISIVGTFFVTTTGLVGVIVGVLVAAPLGLAFTAATMAFVREYSIVGRGRVHEMP
ncbi:MAG: hypothetical protein V5A33_02475 [Halobacteriales archaeon]